MPLEKNRTYACTFAVQRKEINVVKVRFTMGYSSKKLNNKKVITTAQLATFKNKLLVLSSLWVERFYYKANKYLKFPHLFKPGQGIWTKTFTHAHYVFPLWNLVYFSRINIFNWRLLIFFRKRCLWIRGKNDIKTGLYKIIHVMVNF